MHIQIYMYIGVHVGDPESENPTIDGGCQIAAYKDSRVRGLSKYYTWV